MKPTHQKTWYFRKGNDIYKTTDKQEINALRESWYEITRREYKKLRYG